jgi:hypothetical protein
MQTSIRSEAATPVAPKVDTRSSKKRSKKKPAVRVVTKGALMLLGAALAGCAVDGTTGSGEQAATDDHFASSSDALTGWTYESWGGVGTGEGGFAPTFQGGKPAWIDLGVGNGWQCFLSGMFGDTFEGSVSVAQYGGGQSGTIESFENKGPESVASLPTGRWILEISGNDGAALSASAACIPASALGSSTVSDPPPVTLVKNVNHNTLCGFQSLGGSFGLLAPGQPLPFEGSATVTNDGQITPTFTNSSTWTWTDGTDIGVGNESIAACATASPALSWGGAGSSTVTTNFSVASGAMCFLSFVQGEFDVNSFSDGVGLSQVNPTTWTITVSSGKRAGFYCVE